MEIREYREYREDEILRLYAANGWTAYTENPEALRQGFAHSLTVLAAREGGELLGIVRAVGDGHTVVFIQDILVFPDRQRQGVGSSLLKAVLDRFAGVRQVMLVTDDTEKTKAFYRAMGFRELPALGCCGFMKC